MKIIILFCICGLLQCNWNAKAQKTNNDLKQHLDSLSILIPALDQQIDITVNMVPLGEFVRGIAKESGLNVTLDPTLDQIVSNNFNKVKVKDILYFLSENYGISISFAGNIVMLNKQNIQQNNSSNNLQIDYNAEKGTISLEVDGISLKQLAKEITIKTGKNIILMPGTQQLTINTYIKDMPLYNAIEKMAMGNNILMSKTDDGFLLAESNEIIPETNTNSVINRNQGNNKVTGKRSNTGTLNVKLYSSDSIDIIASGADVNEILSKVLDPLKIPYQLLSPITETITMNNRGITIEKLLELMFAGTKTVSHKFGNTYWIGSRELGEMNIVKIVSMQYSTVDSLLPFVPGKLKSGIDIKEFAQQNSFILTGPADRVAILENYLKSIDKVVPVILIEVMIVDNKNSKALSTGITAGLAEKPAANSGTISPGVDLTLGSSSVNNLIDGLNGFGWVNMGKVNPNFYVTLKALETDGFIELRSTPQLSTLNGHKAEMSIGNTEYYKEEQNTIYGSVTTSSQKITSYKPVDAELKITIKPIVAGNRDVTLDISVEQSDFTERISEFAPPGKVSRKFQSLIRVKDQEMILLGGLEEKEVRDTRSGMPLLSRIPILHWFFTSKTKLNGKSKLNIFIKPTIIY